MTHSTSRPVINEDLVLMALELHHLDKKEEWAFEDIARAYRPYKDSYELMRDLERNFYWQGSRDLMDDLEEVIYSVDKTLNNVIKGWVSANNIAPKFNIGADVEWKGKKAKVVKIDKDRALYLIQFYEPYLEKMPCTIGSSSSIYAKYEDTK